MKHYWPRYTGTLALDVLSKATEGSDCPICFEGTIEHSPKKTTVEVECSGCNTMVEVKAA